MLNRNVRQRTNPRLPDHSRMKVPAHDPRGGEDSSDRSELSFGTKYLITNDDFINAYPSVLTCPTYLMGPERHELLLEKKKRV